MTMLYEMMIKLLHRFNSQRVIILGDVMLDRFVYGSAERISPEAPIPVISIERILDMPGGAANVARNLSALGAQCVLLGVVGTDAAADQLRAQLASSPGIESHLTIDTSRPTSLKTRFLADGQQMIRADIECKHDLSSSIADEMLKHFALAIAQADIVVLSDYAKGVLTDEVVGRAIENARRLDKPVIVDPKSKSFKKYAGATVLTPNRLELQRACGFDCLTDLQVTEGSRQILAQGVCDALVVTRGKDGMSVLDAAGLAEHLPTEARQVYDVSGAGDTAVATLALAMASGGTVVEAAALANIAAGIVVGKRGTATVSPAEIMASLPPFGRHADPQKIYGVDNVLPLVREWRERGLTIAFTNGCFDLLHPGHISLLDQARRNADRLIVGLNSDASVRRLKGANRPIQSELARATVLAAVKSVDAVIIFSGDTPLELIETLRPNVLVKGSDYSVDTVVGSKSVLESGGRVVLAQIVAGHSTTATVTRVAHSASA